MREDVVDAIATGLGDGFDPAHALIVRPLNDGYQILSGHHRKAAALRAGLSHVPCWVRDMDDSEAYMTLATSNSQGELSPLEVGMHALGVDLDKRGIGAKGGGLKEYAAGIGRSANSVSECRAAAKVAKAIKSHMRLNGLIDKARHLAEVSKLSESCWLVAVDAMLKGDWSAWAWSA